MFADKYTLKNGNGVAFANKACLSVLPIRRPDDPLLQFDHSGGAVFGVVNRDHSNARG